MTTKNKITIVLLMVSSLTPMAGATIAPALPRISEVFAEEANAVLLTKLILTIPALFIALCSPLVGFVIDKFGRMKPLVVSIILYGIAGASGFYLNDLLSILVSRALLGVAVAGIMTICLTLGGDYFEGEDRKKFMGMQAAYMGFGAVVFISAGGLLADISWRAPFLIYLSSIVLLIPVIATLYEPKKEKSHKSGDKETAEALPKFKILFIYCTALISMSIFYMVPVQLPFLLQEMERISNLKVGNAIAALILVSATVSLNYQRIKSKFSYMTIFAISYFFQALGFILISLAGSYYHVLTALIVAGVGAGLILPNISLWILEVTPVETRGRVVGGLSLFIFTGQFLSPIFAQPLQNMTSLSGSFGLTGIFVLGVFLIFSIGSFSSKINAGKSTY